MHGYYYWLGYFLKNVGNNSFTMRQQYVVIFLYRQSSRYIFEHSIRSVSTPTVNYTPTSNFGTSRIIFNNLLFVACCIGTTPQRDVQELWWAQYLAVE